MKMKKQIAIPFLIIALFLSSCATILNGTKQRIRINSIPPGASIEINGKKLDQVTPCKTKIKRRAPAGEYNLRNHYNVVISKEGYENYTLSERREISGGKMFFSFFFVPVAGLLLDIATGSIYKYPDLKEINAHLKEKQKPDIMYVEKDDNVFTPKNKYEFIPFADVDKNIPQNQKTIPFRFALIIGNEDYSSHQVDLQSEANVEFARNDASAFKQYAVKTLGIPESNITFLLDATTGQMKQAIAKMNLIAKNAQGKAQLFVYYAGHGLPDEQNKEPYLIPVDISGKNVTDGIKLSGFYQKLTEYPTERVTIFIDACFSGGARNQGLLAARSVKIKSKVNELNGNLVVFSASSGEQSALPYSEKRHGIFTYFLLKKMQETRGKVSYNELAKYIHDNIALQSVVINDKEQTPQTNISPAVYDEWKNWQLFD